MAAVSSVLAAALSDRYVIERELGHGGMATVYLARDLRHGRPVALKVLRAELAASLGSERFLREIAFAARLDHPHILPVHDSGETAGHLWYTMPYVRGESLRERLRREVQLPVDVALDIARQVALAIEHAHREGVLHRDLKPENILLSGYPQRDGGVEGGWQARVADFGIAKAASGGEPLTETGLAMGTPAYMSPEQASGARVDARSDTYALGCVLYEMLAGEPPYGGPTVQAIMAKRLSDPVPSVRRGREEVPEYLDAVIRKSLAKIAADRFATAADFAAALDRKPGDEPRRRSRSRPLLAAAIGIGVIAGAAILLSRQQSPVSLDADLVAVAPFDVLDPKLGIWREGLVDYLSKNLDGAGALRAVPPSVAIRRWAGRADVASARDLGRRTGAKLVLVGQVVGAGTHAIRLRASLVDVGNGKALAEFERADQPDRVDRLADSLTVDLLRELGRTRPETRLRLSSVGTASLSALKAFLQGEQSFRHLAWDSAVVHYQRAVALDSAFALALWRLGLANGWAGGDWRHSLLLLLQAGRLNHGLSPRDSLLVTADSLRAAYFDTLDPGYWSHLQRKFSALEDATRLYPEDPESWYELGEARYHNGIVVGTTAQQTLATLNRAIALDSGFGAAYIHAVQLALEAAGPAAAMPYIQGYLASASTFREGHGVGLVAQLLASGKTPTADVPRNVTTSSNEILEAALTLAGWADSGETSLKLLRPLVAPDRKFRNPADSTVIHELLAWSLTYRGHLHEARIVVGDGYGHVFAELAQLGVIPRDTADMVITRWSRSSDNRALRFGSEDGDRCRRTLGAAQWWSAQGDTASLQELIRRGVAAAPKASNVYARFNSEGDIVLGRVGLALARRDTADALRRLLAIPDSLCPSFVPFRLFKAHMLAEAGRFREAAVMFDQTPFFNGDNRSASAVLGLLQRGRVAEQLRDRRKAIQCYQLVLDLWRHADPELQPYLEEATAGLTRMTGEPAR